MEGAEVEGQIGQLELAVGVEARRPTRWASQIPFDLIVNFIYLACYFLVLS
jgi:hypothetical protein